MKQALAKTQPWISAKAKIFDKDRPLTVKINIKDNTISKSFLILEDKFQKVFSFFPITGEIAFYFKENNLILFFTKYDGFSVKISFENLLELELIVSHLEKATLLYNNEPDMFKKENYAFLKSTFEHSFTDIEKNLFSADKHPTSILTPIVLSKTAKSIWESGTCKQNFSFIIDTQTIRFSFLTWNVAGNLPTEETKGEFEHVFSGPVVSSDLVYIAMEELEMTVKSVVTGSSGYKDPWAYIIKKAPKLGENPDYDLILVENIGTLFVAVLVKKSLVNLIKVGEPQTIKFGAGGFLANKAAILLPVTVGECKINIASCHLTAHEQNVEERSEEVREILDAVGDDTDYLFFAGDMNYRITLPYEEAVELARKKNIKELIEYDQLNQEKAKDKRIEELWEPEIKFLPTYKFDKNSDVYDTSSKKRVPSYTDRILVRTGKKVMFVSNDVKPNYETDAFKNFFNKSEFKTECNFSVDKNILNYPQRPSCICYRSLKSKFSDHRPVHAIYKITYPIVKKERVNELNMITQDKYNELVELSIPKISVEPPYIAFNENKREYDITLKNTGYVWVRWSVTKSYGHHIVEPSSGLITALKSTKIHITVGEDFESTNSFFFIELVGGGDVKIPFIDAEKDMLQENNVKEVKGNNPLDAFEYRSLQSKENLLSTGTMSPSDEKALNIEIPFASSGAYSDSEMSLIDSFHQNL